MLQEENDLTNIERWNQFEKDWRASCLGNPWPTVLLRMLGFSLSTCGTYAAPGVLRLSLRNYPCCEKEEKQTKYSKIKINKSILHNSCFCTCRCFLVNDGYDRIDITHTQIYINIYIYTWVQTQTWIHDNDYIFFSWWGSASVELRSVPRWSSLPEDGCHPAELLSLLRLDLLRRLPVATGDPNGN